MDEMARRGLLGLRVPKAFGGHEYADSEFRRFQEACARRSGAFAFLQTQHQSACGFLAKSDNERLKARLLPAASAGSARLGIAFSQLRRPGPPLLTAGVADDGYAINGTAPWVTGWGLFDGCITAATLAGGDTLFFWHPLFESEALQPSQVMRLAAFEVAQTVSLSFKNLRISPDDVLYVRPGSWIQENDLVNIALQSPFALGCAGAAIDVMREVFAKKQVSAIEVAANSLERELAGCRNAAYTAMEDKRSSQASLEARAWAIELAGRAAHAAIAASSGAGNSMSHAAQRVYREALVFTVSAQTTPIMEATLRRLSKWAS
jgi:alkylation response protein AidB-like acyl-CoA dehydrogenase